VGVGRFGTWVLGFGQKRICGVSEAQALKIVFGPFPKDLVFWGALDNVGNCGIRFGSCLVHKLARQKSGIGISDLS